MSNASLDFKRLYAGDCPACEKGVLSTAPTSDMLWCNLCVFKIGKEKFFARVDRERMGRWRVMHRSRTEDENLTDLSLI